MRLLKVVLLFVVSMGVTLTGAWAASTADIVFVVDESGSMSGEHGWIGSMVLGLEQSLVARGVTGNRYGLVGFGAFDRDGHSYLGHQHDVGGGQFGTAAQMSAAASSLVTTGSNEDGYDGIAEALRYNFRPGAAVNIILISDEEREEWNPGLNYADTLANLRSHGALLNVVVSVSYEDGVLGASGDAKATGYRPDGVGGFTSIVGAKVFDSFATSFDDYVRLAWETGNGGIHGAAWDLGVLRGGGVNAESFTKAFVAVKAQEIQAVNAVPEPMTIVLLGSGLMVFAVFSKRISRE